MARFSILSHSLGSCESHPLPLRLRAAAEAGFQAVELFQADLDHHSLVHFDGDELAAARDVRSICASLGLKVLCLQPLRDIPGLASDADREKAWKYGLSRFDVMDALGTDLVLCCSSIRPRADLHADLGRYAEELGRFADAAKARGKRVAYEALAWGTVVSTCAQAWDVVQRADRDNLGLCLDSFNSLGREWADPTSSTGTLSDPSSRLSHLVSFLATVPPSKIFLLQIADARLLPRPLAPSSSASEPPARQTWSRSSRLFPGERDRGAYLPVTDFAKAVVNGLGYRGEWSLEVFNDSLGDEGEQVPAEHAQRGIDSLRALQRDLAPVEQSRL